MHVTTFGIKKLPLLALIPALIGCSSPDDGPSGAELQAVRNILAEKIGPAKGGQPPASGPRPEPALLVDEFYRRRDFWPAWISTERDSPADDLRMAVGNAPHHGLDPAAYLKEDAPESPTQSEGKRNFSPNERAERDRRLTNALFAYATDLAVGRVGPPNGNAPIEADLIALLESSLATDTVADTLETLAPTHGQYRALREARTKFVAIAESGGWPIVAGAGGDESNPSPVLAQRLAIEERLAPVSAEETPAGDIVEALKRFQSRHGIEATGTLDDETQAALDVPVAERIGQIDLALERWRWLPQKLGDRYIWVNVPEYALAVVEQEKPVFGMRIIVGKLFNATPLFHGEITYLVFNPYWNIPESIATEEVLPKGQEYMASQGIEVVESEGAAPRLRQMPGPKNPLGQVKFMFPNVHDVYLHDTPADTLFDREDRRLSHGCIRLEKPFDLAEYLLRPSAEWDRAKIDGLVASKEEKTVSLPQPMPVYIAYFTAVAIEEGRVAFRKDIYEYDRALAESLDGTAKIASRGEGSPVD